MGEDDVSIGTGLDQIQLIRVTNRPADGRGIHGGGIIGGENVILQDDAEDVCRYLCVDQLD